MKKLLCLIPIILLIGCKSGGGFAVAEGVQIIRPAQTNIVEVVTLQTNQVATTITNATGEVYARIGLDVVSITNLQPIITPALIVTNKTLGEGLEKTITGVGRVASAVGVPFAREIAEGISVAAAIVFGFGNRRRRRKAEAERDGETDRASTFERARNIAEDAVAVLVQNVDTVRESALQIPGYREHDASVMKAIKAAQKLLNVHSVIEGTRKSPRVLNDKS
mgnify:CR=1 FL=1|tara:strand:- start:1177 stop:1842 length:666 start_codon:yes stop_codon:yes gene_type:complete